MSSFPVAAALRIVRVEPVDDPHVEVIVDTEPSHPMRVHCELDGGGWYVMGCFGMRAGDRLARMPARASQSDRLDDPRATLWRRMTSGCSEPSADVRRRAAEPQSHSLGDISMLESFPR